ncbi:hypothetical protein F5880DRAFT_644805 [Lentinula raphanica]|nr:hypothetical protein F5880DRAFT_644805 [Lentinula raphanica]
MNWCVFMSCSDTQCTPSASLASPFCDDFPPLPATSLSIDKSKKSPTNDNNEKYKDELESITSPTLLSYSFDTETNTKDSTLGTASPASSPCLHNETNDDSDASFSTHFARYSGCVNPPSQSHIGGVLDSPVVCMHHRAPISPPPTLPTLTADLPSNEPCFATPSLSMMLEPSKVERYTASQAVQFSQFSQPELTPWNAHLLSPLSPQSTSGITDIGPSPHFLGGTAFEPLEGLDKDNLSESLDFDSLVSLDSNSLLFDQDALSSSYLAQSPLDTLNSGTGKVAKPYFSQDSLPTSFARYPTPTPERHFSYPSPSLSPEQPKPMDTSFFSLSTLPMPVQRQRQRHIELDHLLDRDCPEDASGNERFTERSTELSTKHFVDDDYDGHDEDYHHILSYDSDILGFQSPSIRTLSLPDLVEVTESSSDPGPGSSSSFTSYSTSTSSDESPTSQSSSSSSSLELLLSSPKLCSSSASSSSTSTSDPQCEQPELDRSAYQYPFELDLLISDSDFQETSPSNTLLLDMDIGMDVQIQSAPSSQTCTVYPYPDRLPSPNSFIESLDSRLSHLPFDSSCADIPYTFSADTCPEYTILRTHPELYHDLLQLLSLRRKAQRAEKDAKRREKALELEAREVQVVRVDGMRVRNGKEKAWSDSTDTRVPPPSLAFAQSEKAEARSTRQREKEKCREIASLVALTLLGDGGSQRPSSSSASSDDDSKARAGLIEPDQMDRTFMTTTDANALRSKKELLQNKKSKKSKKKVTLVSMAQLVARMILRRRDRFCSSSSFSRPLAHQPLFSPPGVGKRYYVKSPLWQSMTMRYDEDQESVVEAMSTMRECEDSSVGLGVEGVEGGAVVEGDEENQGTFDDDDDDDLGVGLRLKGFEDFGDGPEWPVMMSRI